MVYIIIIASIVLAEAWIKDYIDKHKKLGKKEKILGGKIILNKHYNCGMAMNYFENQKEVVKKVSCIALGIVLLMFAGILPQKEKRLYKLGLSLCLGGAISNVLDRLRRGYVIDYFSVNWRRLKKIVFNLADLFIVLGASIVSIAFIFDHRE